MSDVNGRPYQPNQRRADLLRMNFLPSARTCHNQKIWLGINNKMASNVNMFESTFHQALTEAESSLKLL